MYGSDQVNMNTPKLTKLPEPNASVVGFANLKACNCINDTESVAVLLEVFLDAKV